MPSRHVNESNNAMEALKDIACALLVICGVIITCVAVVLFALSLRVGAWMVIVALVTAVFSETFAGTTLALGVPTLTGWQLGGIVGVASFVFSPPTIVKKSAD